RLPIILFVLFLSFTNLYAQDKIIDSLENKLAGTTNKLEKAKLYNAVSNQYKYSDPAKMLDFGNQALKFSEENQLKTQIGNAYLNIGTPHIILGNYQKAVDN